MNQVIGVSCFWGVGNIADPHESKLLGPIHISTWGITRYVHPLHSDLGVDLVPSVFPIWDVKVQCNQSEYGIFDPPSGQTCGAYMSNFLKKADGYINNPVRSIHLT